MICGGLAVTDDVPAADELAATVEAKLSVFDIVTADAVAVAPAVTDVVACVSGVCAANCHFELTPTLGPPPAASLTR